MMARQRQPSGLVIDGREHAGIIARRGTIRPPSFVPPITPSHAVILLTRTIPVGSQPRRSVPTQVLRRSQPRDPGWSARSHQTALRSRQPLGSVEVTHPFHPLRGQTFAVLKLKTISGIPTLSVRHPDLGSFAIPADWTDWSPANSAPG